jgi:hypothetical protein
MVLTLYDNMDQGRLRRKMDREARWRARLSGAYRAGGDVHCGTAPLPDSGTLSPPR